MTSRSTPLSRRGFLGRAAAAQAVAIAPAHEKPRRAWILVALGWEYNDEFTFPDGAWPETRLYHSREEAESACQRRCAEFFATQTPAEFEVDIAMYLPDRVRALDFDEDSVTWPELQAAGFPDPYRVLELTTPETAP